MFDLERYIGSRARPKRAVIAFLVVVSGSCIMGLIIGYCSQFLK